MATRSRAKMAPADPTLDDLLKSGTRYQEFIQEHPEEAPAAPSGTMRRVLGDGGIALMKGAIGVPEAAVGLADLATGGQAGKMLENEGGMIGFRPKAAKEALDSWKSPEQQAADKAVAEAKGFVDVTVAALRNPSVIGSAIAESLPLMGGGGVVARSLLRLAPATGAVVAGAAGEGVVAMGSQAESIRQETADGLMTGEQSALAAASGVATSLLGYMGGKVAQRLGIADIDTMLAGKAGPEATKGFTRRVLEGAAAEGLLEELPQSVQEQVAQNMALGKPLGEGIEQAAVLGALAGGVMGGGGNAISYGGEIRREKVDGDGAASRALNAGLEATAQQADAIQAGAVPPETPFNTAGMGGLGTPLETPLGGSVDAPPPPDNMAARNQREADRPAPADGEILPGDVVNVTTGKPFTQMHIAMSAAKRASKDGETWEVAPVAGGLVVRKAAEVAPELPGVEAAPPAPPDPAHLPDDVLNPKGAPFTNRGAAATVMRRMGDEFTIAKVAGGFAVRKLAAKVSPVDESAHQAATSPTNDRAEPTDGQKEAENYAMGHHSLVGLKLSIENPAGSKRRGTDRDGKAWENTLQHHYGRIKGTIGGDGEHIDAFVKPGTADDWAGTVFVVDQIHPDTGKFDEHKTLIGFDTIDEAKDAYHANYAKGWKGLKSISSMPAAEFKAWVKAGPQKQPLVPISAPGPAAPAAPVPAAAAPTDQQPEGVADVEKTQPINGNQGVAVSSMAAATLPDQDNTSQTKSPAAAAPAPAGPRVIVNLLGKDGLTDAERAAGKKPYSDPVPSAADNAAALFNAPPADDRVRTTGAAIAQRLRRTATAIKGVDEWLMSDRESVSKIALVSRKGSQVATFPYKDATPEGKAQAIAEATAWAAGQASTPAEDSHEARWTRMPTAEREAALIGAGWAGGSIGAQTMKAKPWATMTPSQKARISRAMDGQNDELDAEMQGYEDKSDAAPAPAPAPRQPRTSGKAAAEAAEQLRADYFTPGNVVKSYSGFDEILSYSAPTTPGGSWSVRVHEVIEKTAGNWVRSGKPQDARQHTTHPEARELKAGPVARLPALPAAQVPYSSPRPGGEPFPNAPDRGRPAAAPAAAPPIKADKAEVRPFRRPDGSIGYEAVPIVEAPRPAKTLSDDAAGAETMGLRKLAIETPRLGDVELANGKFVTLAQATEAARKHMTPEQWAMPFQFNSVLDIAPVDWNRMVAEMAKPAPEVSFTPEADFTPPTAAREDMLNEAIRLDVRNGGALTDDALASAIAKAKADRKAADDKTRAEIAADEKPQASTNTVFTDDAMAAARALLKRKLGGTLTSGIDPEVLQAGIVMAGWHIEKGARTFAAYAKAMVSDLGDTVKPYLKSWYMGVKFDPRATAFEGMDSAGSVESLDVDAVLAAEQGPAEVSAEVRAAAKAAGSAAASKVFDWAAKVSTRAAVEIAVVDSLTNAAKGDLAGIGALAKAIVAELAAETPAGTMTADQATDEVQRLALTDEKLRPFLTNQTNALRDVSLTAKPYMEQALVSLFKAGRVTGPAYDAVATRINDAAQRDPWVQELQALASADQAQNGAKEAPTDDPITQPGLGSEDQDASGSAGGRRGAPAQQPASPADHADLAAGKPGDVGQPGAQPATGATSDGAPGEDVGPSGGAAESGDAGDGRTGSGRAGKPDAGAGSGRAARPAGGAGAGKRAKRAPKPVDPKTVSPANTGPGDFVIADPMKIVGGGQVARFEKNKSAIDLRNVLMEEGRAATAEEQATLAGYTGWGSFGQELFKGTWGRSDPKAGWEARDAWLRENLGQKEWEGMQESIINAHYTDPPTVLAMWSMVERMGFTGGRTLEPSIGIGNFYGMMPPALVARSQRAGIELDPVTGSMAKLLYPQANVQIKGYEDSATPDNFYDLVIGNWPFFETGPADRRYNRLSPTLHDYFFLKALDQAKPGGLVVGITSKGTMDKKGISARLELAKKAELVAAFRLPTGAFEEYAGTKVVTDIIILRKRDKPIGTASGEGWIQTLDHDTAEGTKVSVNEYYHRNPTHVVGKIDFGHGPTTFRPGLIVHRPDDMMAELKRITGLVPEGAFRVDAKVETISYVANHTSDRTNALTKTDQGLFVVAGEYLAPANEVIKYVVKSEKQTAAREAELGALVDMRRLYGLLIDGERAGAADKQRTALREAYEAFTKTNGQLSDSFGLNYLRKLDDPFYPALAALEIPVPGGTGKGAYRPAAILTETTMRGALAIDNPSITDAFVLARGHDVNPTIGRIAELAKKPEAEVAASLVESGAGFVLPNGDFSPADLYLSGNVRRKLREAEAAVEAGNAAMGHNVAALTEVVPDDIPHSEIETQLGATWVPAHVYELFVGHMLDTDPEGVSVAIKNGSWHIDLKPGLMDLPSARTGFGTHYIPFKRLVNAAILNQTINIKRKDRDGREYLDEEATTEVNAKIADMRLQFGVWVWKDSERAAVLAEEYNETRNAYATPKFDGSFLGFQGMALSLGRGPFNLRQHQVNAIWRALVTRKSLNAHEVGTGKTFTMGGIAVESRRYGIAKKPLLFAHNANSKSVAAEIQMMYPAGKILYIDNLGKENIKTRMMQIANDDWDVVVMPHSVIDRIGFKEETLTGMAAEEIADLEAAALEAADDDGVVISNDMWEDEAELAKLRSPTAKNLVKQRLKIKKTIREMAQQASKEDAVSFEDLGVDMILVDEAHEFKKPPIATKMQMKGLQVSVSNRSIAMSFITRYVRSMNDGGNVHLFTGTPITNTMTEVFHMMRYMMQEEMKDASLGSFDGWFGSFAREVEDVELNPAGEYEAVTRLQSFINVPELRRMIGQYMDVVFSDDMPEMQPRSVDGRQLSDPALTEAQRDEIMNGRTEGAQDRPYKKVVNLTEDMDAEQLAVFEKVQGWARSFRSMSKKDRKTAMTHGEPESPIIHEGIAARASFDVRLVDAIKNAGKEGSAELAPHPKSKPARALANLLSLYQSDSRVTQAVFMDQGLSQRVTRREGPVGEKRSVVYPAFSTAIDLIERLVQGGVPREQIALVDGSTSKDKRKQVADGMNNGTIRIVIGSSDSLGVGVNMQKNLRAMHHLDAPWMPGELEQRNGRGHRQGNQWNTVLEYRYLTDRLDGRRWQVLSIKQRFITSFMKSKGETRVIEGDAASDDGGDIVATFAEAAGDPRLLIREKLKKKAEQLTARRRVHENAIDSAMREIAAARESIKVNGKTLKDIQDSGLVAKAAALTNKIKGDLFSMELDGTTLDSRADAQEAIPAWLAENMRVGDEAREIGRIGGSTLFAEWEKSYPTATIFVEVAGKKLPGAGGSLRSLESRIRNHPADTEEFYAKTVARGQARLAQAEKVSKSEFHLQDKLTDVLAQLDSVSKDIEINPVAPPFWLRTGAPVETEVRRGSQTFVVTGHRWSEDGWFVLASDDRGETVIPYLEAKDSQGMALYEERSFSAPVVQRDDKKKPAAAAAAAPEAPKPAQDVIAETPADNTAQTGNPAANESDVVFSRADAPSGGVPMAQASAIVEAIKAAAPRAPKLVLHQLPTDGAVPAGIKSAIERDGAGQTAEAVYFGGEIHVFAGNIASPDRFMFVVAHHEIRHHGLRTMLGQRMRPTMLSLWSNPAVRAAAQRMIDNGKASDRETAVEEALADMPVQTMLGVRGIKGVIAALRQWLRDVATALRGRGHEALASLMEPATWTDADVAALVKRAEKGARAGAGRFEGNSGALDPANPDIRYSRSGAPPKGLKEAFSKVGATVRDVQLPLQYRLGDFMDNAGKLHWWHKSVGTMHNLAKRSPMFRRTYDAVQNFIADVSMYATKAADLAPRILPKLEHWSDLKKQPLSPESAKALAAPIFEGTLMWARDEAGKPVKVADLEASAAGMDVHQKAQWLLRRGLVQDKTLRMWQGLPLSQYESIINGKHQNEAFNAGIVWKDSELKSMFGLTDGPDGTISLYREFRKAVDRSLTDLAVADMLRFGGDDVAPLRTRVMALGDAEKAAEHLRDHLFELAEQNEDRANLLNDTANRMIDKGNQAKDLMARGYAPLMRFGQFTLDVLDENGDRLYFGLFDSAADRAKMARKMRTNFPEAEMAMGTVSEEEYKLFAGVTPETLELFGGFLGLEGGGDDAASQAFQKYVKLTKSNRSAMRRLIERKGVEGFSEDVGRVLAGFVYSNARQTSGNLHRGEIAESVAAFPKGPGQEKDAAVQLMNYVQNPQEEAQALRGLLFAQYLGGSIASALVNMTQPATVTLPYLSQFGGAILAAKRVARAARLAGKASTGDAQLDQALKHAEETGVVSPQEVHQLQAQAMGRASLSSGDGTRAGNLAAAGRNRLAQLSFVWGKLFGMAEQVNRRVTFIAAYQTAKEQGIPYAAKFAEEAVTETQFVYNKGNKPRWARGAVGATLFTFKQYSISYLELMHRMWNTGADGSPERAAGRRAVLLGMAVLMLAGGADGLPFMEDADDVLDAFMQRLGYSFSAKQARQEFLAGILGHVGAEFVSNGLSGLPGAPIDVSGRMGMGNMIPGTGLLPKRTDHTRDAAEILGPAGDLATRAFQAAGSLADGEPAKAVGRVAPTAARNLFQAVDMATTGMYRDQRGRKVLDVDAWDVLSKATSFQPRDVAKVQEASRTVQSLISQNKIRESEIADKWALGMFRKDGDLMQEARDELASWNRKNPESPIRIAMPQIIKRVRAMNQGKAERLAKTAPKEIRGRVTAALADGN